MGVPLPVEENVVYEVIGKEKVVTYDGEKYQIQFDFERWI